MRPPRYIVQPCIGSVLANSMCSLLFVMICCSPANAQLSFEKEPIRYSKTEATDPVAKLIARVNAGTVKLEREPMFGYLKSILNELNVPSESQTLVFAKNSLQRLKISPSNPRAIYFNDETYVGYVPGGDLIEIASTDPILGTVFYTLPQDSITNHPPITRKTEQCLFCHASSHTGRVPGLMMQSVFTDSGGHRVFPSDSIFPKSTGPLKTRWGGWFVTGKHGGQRHLGNLMITSDDVVTSDTELDSGNVVDLSSQIQSNKYLSPHSDLVALLVLQHQVTVGNQLTNANHQARLLLYESGIHKQSDSPASNDLSDEDIFALDQIAEELVDALLMVGLIEFTEPVSGTSRFAQEFPLQGSRDSKGRSLRSLDLHGTLFTYPCSYLIDSKAFDSLPSPLRDSVYRRLLRVLESKDRRQKYQHLTTKKRIAIYEILRDTKAGFPKR